MGEVLKKFSRYFLLDQIAQGGMAEIYRARLAAVDGAGRLIVIKRIQAGYGANNEFLRMFRDEIQTMMGFNHPNIIQLYDYGEENDQPYIAMEFIDGKNLRQYISRAAETSEALPVEFSAYIIEQAASGLHYAHQFRDKITGNPRNIVHRDISPQNILISYEGTVKIIDFGIAKATTNMEETRAGVIKGKPSYLSPEQIIGDPLDGRCDIFALGAVLWELLTGKKLFQGENDLAVLKQIESATTHVKAPSLLNPRVPKELDQLVLKALAKRREQRFQTAEEFQRALHRFLYSYNPEFNPGDLSYYAKAMFKEDIVEDRKRIQRLNDKAETLLAAANAKVAEEGTPDLMVPKDLADRDATTTTVVRREREAVFDVTLNDAAGIRPTSDAKASQRAPGATSPPPGPSSPVHKLTSVTLVSPTRVSTKIHKPVVLEKKGSGAESGFYVFLAAAAVAGVVWFAPQLGIKLPESIERHMPRAARHSADNPDYISPELKGDEGVIQAGTKTVLLKVNVIPSGSATVVTMNGKSVPSNSSVIEAPLDTPIEISAERPDYRRYKKEFTLRSAEIGDAKEWTVSVELDPVRFGFLTVRTTPSAEVSLMVNGRPWKKKTPIENERVPAGTYSIRLSNDVLQMEKSVTVTVPEGKAVSIDERLGLKNP